MIFNMDLTGIEPVTLRVKSSMLTFYTTGPGPPVYYNAKTILFQGLLLLTRVNACSVKAYCSVNIVAENGFLSRMPVFLDY